MLPVTNSYWFRESYLSKFCCIIICEEHKQMVLILNSSEKFIIFLANIRHMCFSMVNSKHRYCRCLLIKIYMYVDHIVLFSLFTKICQKWNVHFCSFETLNLWLLVIRWTTNLHKFCLHNICSLMRDSALALSFRKVIFWMHYFWMRSKLMKDFKFLIR